MSPVMIIIFFKFSNVYILVLSYVLPKQYALSNLSEKGCKALYPDGPSL